MSETRYTGIIRTLPYFGGIEKKGEPIDVKKSRAYNRMMRSFRMLAAGSLECIYIAMAQKPTREVLHCYILVGGKIWVRANISHYVEGSELGEVKCWDDSVRDCKWWAVLTAPVSLAPEPVKKKGFQGFRYTEDLW